MIIFDLDGTLADCEHRRHFVDPKKDQSSKGFTKHPKGDGNSWVHKETYDWWKPDYKSFYEACDKDTTIEPVCQTLRSYLRKDNSNVQIWSGRCESVRKKTWKWLQENVFDFTECLLKMRPIGNSEPDDQLKEMWLNDTKILEGKTIDFVFDDRPKVRRMWRRRGIFVFNCCQHDGEF